MEYDQDIIAKFSGINIAEGMVSAVQIKAESRPLEAFKNEVADIIRSRYSLDTVKDDPGFRAYRDFFWSVGTEETKNIRIVSCGVPHISKIKVLEAYGTCSGYLKEYSGGMPSEPWLCP